MSLKKYDEALERKLLGVYPNVLMVDDSEAFEKYASEHKDGKEKVEVRLPLISFYRINNPFNFETFGNDSHIRRGRYVIEEKSRIKAFPVNIMYQIDIWSDRKQEVDDIWRELVMFLYEDPEIEVEFDGLSELYSYNTHLVQTDNTTDVATFYDKGRIYRQSINLEVRQAQMLFLSNVSLAERIPVRVVAGEDDDV